MKLCSWTRGCSITIATAENLCMYHEKIRDGFITTTRDEWHAVKVVDVPITRPERLQAARRRAEYWARWERLEQERRDREAQELEKAWDRALGTWGPIRA